MKDQFKKLIIVVVAIVVLGLGYYIFKQANRNDLGDGFVGGNGRIEATEIDIAAKIPARVEEILVREGDFVKQGQLLAIMQTDVLQAQLDEAKADLQQAKSNEIRAKAKIVLSESDKLAAEAELAKRENDFDAAIRRFSRSSSARSGAVSAQQLDDDETAKRGARAVLEQGKAQVTVAVAAIEAAKAEAEGAASKVKAAEATVNRIQADINDSRLLAPRDGRIQYRVAQPGEVLAAGGRLLNMVDLSDVYMTFFLPTAAAGQVGMGTEVRLVLDAFPNLVIPANISFVASTAQFTPKTVETADERQKLMFRVRAQIPVDLLERHLKNVKIGLPGEAWIKIDKDAEWPAAMTERLLK